MKRRITRCISAAAVLLIAAMLSSCSEEPFVWVEPPEESLTAGEVTNDGAIVFGKIYSEPITEGNGESTVNLANGSSVTVEYTSKFYGSESAIDRDSHHLGNIYRNHKIDCYEFPQNYIVADVNGDRYGEILTYADGLLTVSAFPLTGIFIGELDVQYTQKLDFSGQLCGAGDFNGDGYVDLLLFSDLGRAFIGFGSEEGFTYENKDVIDRTRNVKADTVYAGDGNGDGICDIVSVSGSDVYTYVYNNIDGTFAEGIKTSLLDAGSYVDVCLADINSDGICDVAVAAKSGSKYTICTYFGRGDGQYGPAKDERGNRNLYPLWEFDDGVTPVYLAGGDITGDGVDDIVTLQRGSSDKLEPYYLEYPTEAPAYDYSSHVIKTDDGYILYSGGLYVDYNKDKYNTIDSDHLLAYTSKDGINWHRNLAAPCLYIGTELGENDKWWSGNTMEPEVIYVDGTYYMYFQCENYSQTKEGERMGADVIGVATSKDGLVFTRASDTPVITTTDQYACFTHQEVIYVADDADGKPFWMYVRYVHNNAETKRMLIRSADPMNYDLEKDGVEVAGFHEIGNQVGYLRGDDGKIQYFVRITFLRTDAQTVPTLQFSPDGINWSVSTELRLAAVDKEAVEKQRSSNYNMYFLGMSTINGTGEIERMDDGSYKILYIGCTSNSPMSPAIFASSEGVGECTFRITGE